MMRLLDINDKTGVMTVQSETGVIMHKIEGSSDPAVVLLDRVPRTPKTIHRDGCYICEDDEFARMGLPLCKPCPVCTDGHIAADDVQCDRCDLDLQEWYATHAPEVTR